MNGRKTKQKQERETQLEKIGQRDGDRATEEERSTLVRTRSTLV